jgi:hypothetical protein
VEDVDAIDLLLVAGLVLVCQGNLKDILYAVFSKISIIDAKTLHTIKPRRTGTRTLFSGEVPTIIFTKAGPFILLSTLQRTDIRAYLY